MLKRMARTVTFDEYGWETAVQLEAKSEHGPWKMRSGQSRGPIRMWICDFCQSYLHTIGTGPVPYCYGPSPSSNLSTAASHV